MQKLIQFSFLIIWFSLPILVLPGKALSQPSEIWKINNEKENRYEGRISIEVNAPPIELISFYSYQEEYSFEDILKVKFFFQDSSSNIRLTAQELKTKEFYWMEAKPWKWQPGWNEFGPWPAREVLQHLEIPPDNLGVLVRLGKQYGSGLIAPAILYYSSPPPEIESYKAYFRSGKSLVGGKYQIFRGCEGNEIINQGLVGRQRAGVTFPVIFSLQDNWRGLVKFRIEVKLKSAVTPVLTSREYCFYHISTLSSSASP